MVYRNVCCLELCWILGFDQSFGTYGCQKLICMDCRGQLSDCLEAEGKSLLFSSNPKRLQSEVSRHVGDTCRGAVFVILVDEASCTCLFCCCCCFCF